MCDTMKGRQLMLFNLLMSDKWKYYPQYSGLFVENSYFCFCSNPDQCTGGAGQWTSAHAE